MLPARRRRSQDTTDTQSRCLELLQGLRSLVVIGDPDQAIYGFVRAEPAGLERLVRSRSRPPGAHRELVLLACHLQYEEGSLRRAVEVIERRLRDLALTAGKVAVLCRGRGTRLFKGRLADLAEPADVE